MGATRALRRTHRHLTLAASAWVDRGRDPDELYAGARLAGAEAALAGDTVALNRIETEYLAAAVDRRDAAVRLQS